MPSPPRSDHKLDLGPLPQASLSQIRASNSTGVSPAESPANALRYPLGNSMATVGGALNRTGAGSPSKEYGQSRLFGKRAREIQAQEGITPPLWGPPPAGSGHSTPLRETIPESPGSDSFPEFDQTSLQPQAIPVSAQQRRARAGTVPSRFPAQNPLGTIGPGSSTTLQSSPQRQSDPATLDSLGAHLTQNGILSSSLSPNQKSILLSRFRAGSTPQRTGLLSTSSAFGAPFLSSGWSSTPRSRANTLQSLQSSGGPSSPALSSRDSFHDTDVKTLDYLGLVDPPQSLGMATLSNPLVASLAGNVHRDANRLRSWSVNAKGKNADEDEVGLDPFLDVYQPPIINPEASASAQAAALREAVMQHNAEVQAFTQLASASRPRARTAGMVEAPSGRMLRNFHTPSRLDRTYTPNDGSDDGSSLIGDNLTEAVANLQLQSQPLHSSAEDIPQESPTRALWLGNIPPSTTASSLEVIFSSFGPIESSRVLTHKGCGFVNYESVESAVQAKATLHNKEIFPGAGAVRIGYAKVPSPETTPSVLAAYAAVGDDYRTEAGASSTNGSSMLRPNANIHAETAAAALKTPKLRDLRSDLTSIVVELGADKHEQASIGILIENAISYNLYHDEIPPIPEPAANRIHDAPRLREIRKRIDNNSCSQAEIENIAMEMLPEIGELSSDYLGNTVVQKLFECCSEPVKEIMLVQIAPRLAEIGVHKNGTWAAQRIIDVAKTPTQRQMIIDALRPYAVQLFLDQYGNYVIQCCLKFGSPSNDFIFDAMLQKLWEIAQGRFGARAMRACLESHYSTEDQRRMMASAIALHSVQLATNANGALLLTWFLDTCTFPQRRTVLAPRLIAHLVHLCTHKVAYLTVLKIINQRGEPDAREAVVEALFFSPENKTLYDVLSDQTSGATFVFKVLTTPFMDDQVRPQVLENIKSVLLQLKASPQQGYKRLMDEVGLSTRGPGNSRDQSRTRSASRGRMPNGHMPQMVNQNSPYASNAHLDPMMAGSTNRAASVDSSVYDPYAGNNGMSVGYSHTPPMGVVSQAQYQQQQQYLAQQQAARQGMYYPNAGIPMNGFSSPVQVVDPFGRPTVAGSPMQAGIGMASPMLGQVAPGYAPPGFNGMNMPPGMYGQYGYYGHPQPQALPQNGTNGNQRRGRANRGQ